MPTRFELYGISLETFTPFEDYTEKDKDLVRKLDRIRWVNPKAFGILTNPDSFDRKGTIEDNDSVLEYDLDKNWARLVL